MKSIFMTILLFFYIYSIEFIFLPQSTRSIMGFLGIIWFYLLFIQQKKSIHISNNLFKIFVLLNSVGFIALISIIYNLTADFHFVKFIISMIVIYFASYFVIMCLKKLKLELDFKTVSSLLINVVLIQSIVAFVMFLIPEFRDMLINYQKVTSREVDVISIVSEFRIVGFGANFFWSGIVNGFALILIAIQIRTLQFTLKQLLFLSIKFLVILVVGMMMARTTIVGAILALTIIFMPKNLRTTLSILKTRALFLFSIIFVPILVTSIILFFFPHISTNLSPIFEYGFEIFINYFNEGSFETASSNDTLTMYIIPTEIKTWIIGDGYFTDPSGSSSYYMHTDVGYLRLIYYFGIVGLISYFSFQIYSIVLAYKIFDINKKFYFFIVAYFFILNLKGLTDLFFINILFIMAYLLKSKENINT